MSAKRKAKFRVGQVVFVRGESYEYERIKAVGPTQDLGMTEVRCFNPRWGGEEVVRAKHVRPLTRREKGDAR